MGQRVKTDKPSRRVWKIEAAKFRFLCELRAQTDLLPGRPVSLGVAAGLRQEDE
jgi:hypothetical protein